MRLSFAFQKNGQPTYMLCGTLHVTEGYQPIREKEVPSPQTSYLKLFFHAYGTYLVRLS